MEIDRAVRVRVPVRRRPRPLLSTVLELVGDDVAAFCDDLVKDSRTYADIYQESISGQPGAGT